MMRMINQDLGRVADDLVIQANGWKRIWPGTMYWQILCYIVIVLHGIFTITQIYHIYCMVKTN